MLANFKMDMKAYMAVSDMEVEILKESTSWNSALDLVLCNTFFKKWGSRLITFTSGGSSTQIDYILTKRKNMKLVIKDTKVISGEEIAAQHPLLVCDLAFKLAVPLKSRFTPRRKIWKLKENVIKEMFATDFASVPLREDDV